MCDILTVPLHKSAILLRIMPQFLNRTAGNKRKLERHCINSAASPHSVERLNAEDTITAWQGAGNNLHTFNCW